MAKLIYVILPYPTLIRQGIRSDFGGTLNIIHRINEIMQRGLRLIDKKALGKKVSPGDGVFTSHLKRYLRHYLLLSNEAFDVTSFFKKEASKLKVVYAYGNALEFTFENLKVDEILETFEIGHDLDSHVQYEFFDGEVSKKIYEIYC